MVVRGSEVDSSEWMWYICIFAIVNCPLLPTLIENQSRLCQDGVVLVKILMNVLTQMHLCALLDRGNNLTRRSFLELAYSVQKIILCLG